MALSKASRGVFAGLIGGTFVAALLGTDKNTDVAAAAAASGAIVLTGVAAAQSGVAGITSAAIGGYGAVVALNSVDNKGFSLSIPDDEDELVLFGLVAAAVWILVRAFRPLR